MLAPNPAPESAASNSPPLRAAVWWSRSPGSTARGSNPWLGDANALGFANWQMCLEPANEAHYAGFRKLSGEAFFTRFSKLEPFMLSHGGKARKWAGAGWLDCAENNTRLS